MFRHILTLCALLVGLALPMQAQAIEPTPTAELLSGLAKDYSIAGGDKSDILKGYTDKVVHLWQTFETNIATPMRAWSATELKRTPGETIFYPFSGPDFPTVQLLYPEASRYVMVALQTGGRMPDLAQMTEKQANSWLRTFRTGWESFTTRGFYDTDDLKRDTGKKARIEGITPVLMAFSVRLGYTIDKVEPMRINASGSDLEVNPADRNVVETWDSVRLSLRNRTTGAAVILDYVHLDLSDGYLTKNTNAKTWIENMSKHRVVTKAASHLMQKPFFSIVKNAVLQNAPTIWQDETGIDYGELSKHFDLTLYGKFTKANKLFIKGIQQSLANAYKRRDDIKPLPFKVGYKKESGSCVQVGVRR